MTNIKREDFIIEGSNPNFFAIAAELKHMEKVGDEGWWDIQDMYAESILRDFGPIIAEAALVVGTGRTGMNSLQIDMLDVMLHYIQCLAMGSDETDNLQGLTSDAMEILVALKAELLRKEAERERQELELPQATAE